MWTTIRIWGGRVSTRRLAALACFFTCLSAFSQSFTDPLYESLNSTALRVEYQRLTAIENPSPSETLNKLQTGFFLAEALGFAEAIHEKSTVLEKLEATCTEQLAVKFTFFKEVNERAAAAFTCALIANEQLGRVIQFSQAGYASRIHAYMAIGNEAKGENVDRLYAEGRLYYRLPASLGGRAGKSLLAWQFLKRLSPAASSVDFWLGHAHLKRGDEKKARKSFEAALGRKDPRALAYFGDAHFARNPDHLDGLSWGLRPALFLSPVAGFGGVLHYHDDRLWDTKRSGVFSVMGSTQGSYGIGFLVTDKQSFERSEINFGMDFGVYNHEFYGLGMQTAFSDRSQLKTQQFSGRLSFTRSFWDYLFLEVGWLFEAHNVRSVQGTSFQSANLTDKTQSFGTGPYGRFAYDDRDSRVEPRRGFLAQVEAQFPTRGLGSQRSFERWSVGGEGHVPLGLLHGLHFQLGAQWLRGDAPYGWYPRLNGRWSLPGVRRDRFQEKAVALASAEYRYRLLEAFSLAGFLTAGRVADTPGGLFSFPYHVGAGLALAVHPSDLYSPSVRLEFGVFGRETVFQVTGSASL